MPSVSPPVSPPTGTVTHETIELTLPGQHRPFAFLTIETTPAQLRKCELAVRSSKLTDRLEHHVRRHVARCPAPFGRGQASLRCKVSASWTLFRRDMAPTHSWHSPRDIRA